MSDAGAVHSFAIVVYRHLTVHDLLPAVCIDIRHREIMVALPGEDTLVGIAGVENPARLQFSVAEIPGGQDSAGVISAAHDQ